MTSRARRVWIAALVLAALAVGGCRRARTSVVVSVESDLPVGPSEAFSRLVVEVRSDGPGGALHWSPTFVVGPRSSRGFLRVSPDAGPEVWALPLSFTVEPLVDDAAHVFWVQARACGPDACERTPPLATTRAITGWVPGQTLALSLALSSRCRDVRCDDPLTTCRPDTQRCETAVVPAANLTRYGTDAATPGPDAVADGGLDAAVDAPVDTPADACTTPGCNAVTQLSMGADHSCALLQSGEVYCWGSNAYGQLGVPLDAPGLARCTDPGGVVATYPCGLVAQRVVGLPPVDKISAGATHTCALARVGGVWCWGENRVLQLGYGPSTRMCPGPGLTQECEPTPNPVPGPTNATAVFAGDLFTCAVTDGVAQCWGDTECGERGAPATLGHAPINGLGRPVSQMALGDRHACAVVGAAGAGQAYCWGQNAHGEVGSTASGGTGASCQSPYVSTAVPVEGLPAADAVVAVSASAGSDSQVSCARLASGEVWCWGNQRCGALANGVASGCDAAADLARPPARVPFAMPATHVGLGNLFGCALLSGGAVQCWGDNAFRELSTATGAVSVATPVGIPGLVASALGAGYRHACAARASGAVVCWGENASAQLGRGTQSYSEATLVPVMGLP